MNGAGNIFTKDHMIKLQTQLNSKIQSKENIGEFPEAIAYLEKELNESKKSLINTKNEYQEFRKAAINEQKLLVSAWYELNLKIQKITINHQNVSDMIQQNDIEKSWLSKQRDLADQSIRK
jgi:hypothetical protein